MKELGELEKHHGEFAARKVRVIAVSNDDREIAQATQHDFPNLVIVADSTQNLAKALGAIHPGVGPQGTDTNAPTTFLIDGAGTVRWLFRPGRILTRLPAAELLAAIDAKMQ